MYQGTGQTPKPHEPAEPVPVMDDRERLLELLEAQHACISIVTMDEAYALDLLRDLARTAGADLRVWAVSQGWHDGLSLKRAPVAETENAAAAIYYQLHYERPCVCVMLDLAPHLDEPKCQRLFRDMIERFRELGQTVVLINYSDSLPDAVAAHVTRFELNLPDVVELSEIIRSAVREISRSGRIRAKLTKAELRRMAASLMGLSRVQARQVVLDATTGDHELNIADVPGMLASKRKLIHRGGLLEFVESPATLDQIAGYANLKKWLNYRRNSMDERGQAFGLQPPRGILMLGVPGAGKSLCAKAVASAWQRPLLRLDPSVLYDRYVGASEQRLREALSQAQAMAPIVLWIDEIEKGFASAASQSTDGGLSQRMFGSLLTWMQEHRSPVFMFATANDINALPPELLRKGRFDEIFFVDLPTPVVRKRIFAIHLARRGRDPEAFVLPVLVAASDGRTGAEIEQAIVSALYAAYSDERDITTQDILDALNTSPPLSVTMGERIEALRHWATGRCVPAD